MSIRKTTERHARAFILSQCRQFIEDTPWDEPGRLWDNRVEDLAKMLDSETGADISEKAVSDLRELLTTLEEIQSVDAGTHHRLVMNHTLTINNRPDLLDEFAVTLRNNVSELLQAAAFRAKDEGRVAGVSERDELVQIIWDEAVADRVKDGKDLRNVPVVRPKVEGMADKILAAGYRKPRTITTYEDLEALFAADVNAIILSDEGFALQNLAGGWKCPGSAIFMHSDAAFRIYGPIFTVLSERTP